MWKRRKLRIKQKNNFKKIFLFVFIFLLILLIVLIFKSGVLSVKKLEIVAKGLSCVDETKLKDSANLIGQNFFFLDQKNLQETLKHKFYCVKEVNLSRVFPSSIKIEVMGRQPKVTLVTLKEKEASGSFLALEIATPSAKQINESFLVDDEGVVFTKNTNNGNNPKVYVQNLQISLGKKLDFNFTNSLKIINKIKSLRIEAKEYWMGEDIFMVNPFGLKPKIIFNLKNNIAVQLASLQLILAEAKIDSSELEFIDLRFDKPIAKFAPKK